LKRRTRGADQMNCLQGGTLALVEQYHRRFDVQEQEFRALQEDVKSYKASVDRSFAELVTTQRQICAALEHLPNQLLSLFQPVDRPPGNRSRRRRHRNRNRRRHVGAAMPSSPDDDDEEEVLGEGSQEDEHSGDDSPRSEDDVGVDGGEASDESGDVPVEAPPFAPTETLHLNITPPAATAIVIPPPPVVTVNEALMAQPRQPTFNNALPSSAVAILADWRLLRLDDFADVKRRTKVWGTPKAQAYAKREYLVEHIRDCAIRVVDPPGPHPATRIEREDMAAVTIDFRRVDAGLTTGEYLIYLKKRDPKVRARKKKNAIVIDDG
jgi:hypothetical protein